MLRPILATGSSAVTFFVWGGISQIFPWGPSSAHVVTTQANPPLGGFHLREPLTAPPESLATAAFDEAYSGQLGMLFTDRTVSWISSKPIEYYDGASYLMRQAGTQLVVAALLVGLLLLLAPLPPRRRFSAVALAAVAGCTVIYGALANWWGLAPAYAIGESANLLVGWVLAATVAAFALSWRSSARMGQTQHG
ncbi:MAG: hypothetical protein AAF293_00555 [Pseudomonadota bacterium]